MNLALVVYEGYWPPTGATIAVAGGAAPQLELALLLSAPQLELAPLL